MIWTLLCLCIFIAAVVILIFGDSYDNIWTAALLIAICVGFALVCMGGFIISEHTFVDQKIEALQAERDAIVYQMDNKLYLGDALGKFNSKIISWRHTYENPWTSWFQGDYIYEVDPIELK